MGLFTNKYMVTNEETVSVLSDETIFEYNQEVTAETGYQLVAEAEENWNNIMKAVGIYELNYFEEHGTDVVYEASNAGSFIDKIKDFFKMVWEKIVAVFKKFFATIDSLIKSDKEFVKKYKKELLAKDKLGDFKFKGFKYTIDAVSVAKAGEATNSTFKGIISNYDHSAVASDLKKFAEVDELAKISEKYEKRDEFIEEARAAIISKFGGSVGSKLDSKEFDEELAKALRDKKDDKDELTLTELGGVEKILSTIENMPTKKEAQKEYTDLKKTIDALIKKLDNWKQDIVKADGNKDESAMAKMAAAASKYSTVLKDDLGLLKIVNAAKLQAIKEENRQCKAICVKLLTYKPKNESVTHYSESGSFLDSVVLR